MYCEPSSQVTLPKDGSYLPELWALYGIGVVVILLRWAVRIRTVGIKGFQGDDYLSILYLAFYTANIVIVQVTYYSGGNIDVTADKVKTLPQSDIDCLRYGSILEFVSWYTYPGTIWTLKFMVLYFYCRLTMGILRTRTIRFLFWACGASWIALILTVSLSCRPYHHNWQMRPLPGPECTFRAQNFWVLVVLNVTTDTALLSIPVPILWHLRVSKRRKVAVSILLLGGLFVITTAIVRVVMTVADAPSVININRWGFREICVGLVAVSAPILMPFFTRGFWRKGPFVPDRWKQHGMRPAPGDAAEPGFGTWIGAFELRDAEVDESGLVEDPNSSSGLEEGMGRFSGGTWSGGNASIEMRDGRYLMRASSTTLTNNEEQGDATRKVSSSRSNDLKRTLKREEGGHTKNG